MAGKESEDYAREVRVFDTRRDVRIREVLLGGSLSQSVVGVITNCQFCLFQPVAGVVPASGICPDCGKKNWERLVVKAAKADLIRSQHEWQERRDAVKRAKIARGENSAILKKRLNFIKMIKSAGTPD